MAAICVFCGSQSGASPVYAQAARAIGRSLAGGQHTLVYGGGSTGMMGAIADCMIEEGASVIGVIPEALATVELMHTGVTDMRVVSDMHARKAMMHELSDGYLAMPGGFGTLEEIFEALCWAQLDFHQSPVALLNIEGFYDGLVKAVHHMVTEEFLQASHAAMLAVLDTPEQFDSWLAQRFRPAT